MIKHIWFDFSDTLAKINLDVHDKIRYETYAKVVGKPVTPELIKEYEELYTNSKNSNSAVFESLGMPNGYWGKVISEADSIQIYSLAEDNIPEVLKELNKIIPISIFSNIDPAPILKAIGIDPELFTHILSSKMAGRPKPALDGFYKLIEMSGLPAEEILFIGDHVGKEIIPAKKVGLKTGLMWSQASEADYNFSDFKEILELFSK
jgi:HAD superfamily hydrolase (TIGR01549 family)